MIRAFIDIRRFLRTQYRLSLLAGFDRRHSARRAVVSFFKGY